MNIRFESLKGWIGETFATKWEHHQFWFEKNKKVEIDHCQLSFEGRSPQTSLSQP